MNLHTPGTQQPQLETDPRFPSGRWVGFWLQRAMPGRQHMSLRLTFVDGKIIGTGSDRVGDFDFSGDYDLVTGKVTVAKRYLKAHSVSYTGQNENDGQWIWGLWNIRSLDRGGFHLWPAGENDPTGQSLKEDLELPLDERKRVVSLDPVFA